MSCGVSLGDCCDALDGCSGAAWIVVVTCWVLSSPPKAAITATATPAPSSAETKGMANRRFITSQDDRYLLRASKARSSQQLKGSLARAKCPRLPARSEL